MIARMRDAEAAAGGPGEGFAGPGLRARGSAASSQRRLGLRPSGDDNRRVLAVPAYLDR